MEEHGRMGREFYINLLLKSILRKFKNLEWFLGGELGFLYDKMMQLNKK
jgi:hypothetical protein